MTRAERQKEEQARFKFKGGVGIPMHRGEKRLPTTSMDSKHLMERALRELEKRRRRDWTI